MNPNTVNILRQVRKLAEGRMDLGPVDAAIEACRACAEKPGDPMREAAARDACAACRRHLFEHHAFSIERVLRPIASDLGLRWCFDDPEPGSWREREMYRSENPW